MNYQQYMLDLLRLGMYTYTKRGLCTFIKRVTIDILSHTGIAYVNTCYIIQTEAKVVPYIMPISYIYFITHIYILTIYIHR